MHKAAHFHCLSWNVLSFQLSEPCEHRWSRSSVLCKAIIAVFYFMKWCTPPSKILGSVIFFLLIENITFIQQRHIHLMKMTVKTFIILQNVSISNKCYFIQHYDNKYFLSIKTHSESEKHIHINDLTWHGINNNTLTILISSPENLKWYTHTEIQYINENYYSFEFTLSL